MGWVLLAVGVLFSSGCCAALSGRNARLSTAFGVGGALSGCALAMVGAIGVLGGAPQESLRLAWSIPHGAFFVALDGLSGLFLAVICGLCAPAAIYGGAYLRHQWGKRSMGPPWFFFNLLVASMVMVVVARNALLFLMAWEVMALSSFFLVTFDDEEASVRDAGWLYLVASHLGTTFLLVLFVLLGRESGSLDFDRLVPGGAPAGVLFVLALLGFGTKAGFVPLHVWLPEAHPAAPSHVSAVMSGVMIKMGIYGLVRALTFLGPPSPWWGWALCAVGLTSAIGGVLFALAQHDLKRLLAYSSVENTGIVAVGLGVGLLGIAAGTADVAMLGFAGALLHVLNHACFKGLLFLGAGAVAHAAGTREIDRLGGLLRRMPWTGGAFLVGAAAICGLPPLNGFISEWLIYVGSFRGVIGGSAAGVVPLCGAIGGLALTGGIAAACFAKAFGVAFLGEPRSEPARLAGEVNPAMWGPMVALAAACAGLGLFGPAAVRLVLPAVATVLGHPQAETGRLVQPVAGALAGVAMAAWAVLLLAAGLAALRHLILRRRTVVEGVTWDCGYVHPSARMQYTASSFAAPLTNLFGAVLRSRRDVIRPTDLFPRDAFYATRTDDVCRAGLFEPLFAGITRALSGLRWLQHGRVHLYVLYITVTLLVLLVWKLG